MSKKFKNYVSVNYSKQGVKNKSSNPRFVNLCRMTQKELKAFLQIELKKYYHNVISQDGFLYVKGKQKVLLTAHMDTVHKEPVKDFYELIKDGKHIISSPQGIGGDDRCGIYMILEILRTTKLRPFILFCEDEEVGGDGSDKFTNTNFINDLKKLYFLVELDRKGINDLVYYEDENEKFHEFCARVTGFRENYGSFSDISNLSPACSVSSVNISCGYYNQHTKDEYVVLEEMYNATKKVINMIEVGVNEKTQYVYEVPVRNNYMDYDYWDNHYNYSRSVFGYRDYSYSSYNNYTSNSKSDDECIYLEVSFVENGDVTYDSFQGSTEEEAWGKFFLMHDTVCFNDLIDYDTYTNDELKSLSSKSVTSLAI